MKLVLINPGYHSDFGVGMSFGEPLGLAYVAAAIAQSGRHEVSILDGLGACGPEQVVGNGHVGLTDDQMLAQLAAMDFDALGVSLSIMSCGRDPMLRLTRRLKKAFPDKPLIGGGPDITVAWKHYLTAGGVDYAVRGEGEATIVELLDGLDARIPLGHVAGIAFRDTDGTARCTATRPALDIDSLRWPARHLLPMSNYFQRRSRKYFMRAPAAALLTSRACPFSCVFCNLHDIWGKRWRGRDPLDTVDEIEYLVRELGVREIHIQDSNFLVNRPRAEAICDEIIRRKLDISMQVQPGLAVWILTRQLLDKLRRAGLYTLCAQIESGNPDTVAYIHKKIDFDHARDVIRYANRIGMWTQSNIILGFPNETKADIRRSIRTAESMGVDQINYLFPILYEGTKLREDYIAEGLVPTDFKDNVAPIGTRHLSSRELGRICLNAKRWHVARRASQVLTPRAFRDNILHKIDNSEKIRFLARRVCT